MYKIAALCAIAIGIPHYLLAEKAQVSCQQGGEEVGTLFEGKSISVDKNIKSRIYSPAELNRRCQDQFLSSELEERLEDEDRKVSENEDHKISEDEDHKVLEDEDRKVTAVLKKGS